MTPIGLFLILMFGVFIPSPIHGRIKMTFQEVLSMNSSALEKRQGPPEELAALFTLMKCLDKLGQGTDTPCSDSYYLQAAEKYLSLDLEDIPLNVWERVSKLKCQEPLVCDDDDVCTCRRSRPDYGNPDRNPRVPCNRVERDPRVKCDKEYRAYHKVTSPRPPPTQNVLHVQLHNHGVSVSISGCFAAIAIAIFGRHLFLP